MELIQAAVDGSIDIDLLLDNEDSAIENQPHYEKYKSLQYQILLILMEHQHTKKFEDLFCKLNSQRTLDIEWFQIKCIETKNKKVHELLRSRFGKHTLSSRWLMKYLTQDPYYLLWLSERYNCDFCQYITDMLSTSDLSPIHQRIIFNFHKSLPSKKLIKGMKYFYIDCNGQTINLNIVIDNDNASLLEVYLDLFPTFDRFKFLPYVCKQDAIKCYQLIVGEDTNLKGMLIAFTTNALSIINHYSTMWQHRINIMDEETVWNLISTNKQALKFYAMHFITEDNISKIINKDNHSKLYRLFSTINYKEGNKLALLVERNINLHGKCSKLITHFNTYPMCLYPPCYYMKLIVLTVVCTILVILLLK